MNEVNVSTSNSNKKTVLLILIPALVVGFIVAIVMHIGRADMPRVNVLYGEAAGRAIGSMIAPLMVWGFSGLSAKVKKQPTKNVSKAMWITWGVVTLMSTMGSLGKR